MEKIRVFVLILAVSALLASCDNSVFKQFDDDFADSRWEKSDIRRYDVNIPKTGNYEIIVNFSTVYGGQFSDIPVKLTIESPDKSVVSEEAVLRLKDDQGNDVADCTGDICDLEQVILSNKKLEAGQYTITLSNAFNHEFLPNVIGVGIRIVALKNNQ